MACAGRNVVQGSFATARFTSVRAGGLCRRHPLQVPECLDAFEKYHHEVSDIDPLIRAFMAHYQFETIHPFRDGNGRVGRLLLSLTIYIWLELSSPWLYMSAFFERHKDEYIDRLFMVSANGEWDRWVEFCLMGVVEQSVDAIDRIDKLVALRALRETCRWERWQRPAPSDPEQAVRESGRDRSTGSGTDRRHLPDRTIRHNALDGDRNPA